jgi:hypothetical protein
MDEHMLCGQKRHTPTSLPKRTDEFSGNERRRSGNISPVVLFDKRKTTEQLDNEFAEQFRPQNEEWDPEIGVEPVSMDLNGIREVGEERRMPDTRQPTKYVDHYVDALSAKKEDKEPDTTVTTDHLTNVMIRFVGIRNRFRGVAQTRGTAVLVDGENGSRRLH